MNIVEQFERIRFWLDVVASPRFDITQMENAINDAIISIVDSKYESSKQINLDSFQRTQKIRDQLSNLIYRHDQPIPGIGPMTLDGVSNASIFRVPLTTETKYRYLICASAKNTDTGESFNLWPLSYNRMNVISSNPFRKPRNSFFGKWYYNEYHNYIEVFAPSSVNNITAEIFYLNTPTKTLWGKEYNSDKVFAPGNKVIAVSPVIYMGSEKKIGTEFYILPTYTSITSGNVLYEYVESDVNSQLHEIICRMSALNLMLTTKDSDRYKELKEKTFIL